MTRVFDADPDPIPPAGGGGPRLQLGLTTRSQVAVALLSGLVVGWFVVSTFAWLGSTLPVTPWSMSMGLLIVAAVALIAARVLKQRLDDRRLDPQTAVFLLVLGKTMVLTGALLAGGHLSYLLTQVSQWAVPLPRQRVIFGAVAAVASAIFAAAGSLLERALWRPPSDHLEAPAQSPQG